MQRLKRAILLWCSAIFLGLLALALSFFLPEQQLDSLRGPPTLTTAAHHRPSGILFDPSMEDDPAVAISVIAVTFQSKPLPEPRIPAWLQPRAWYVERRIAWNVFEPDAARHARIMAAFQTITPAAFPSAGPRAAILPDILSARVPATSAHILWLHVLISALRVLGTLLAALALFRVTRLLARYRRRARNCLRCAYSLAGLNTRECPECGEPIV